MNKKSNILAGRLNDAFIKYAPNDALSFEGKSFSYRELHTLSNAICRAVGLEKNNSGNVVAVLGAKSLFTYAGICGALFSSSAYMPINLKFPVARICSMLELSATNIIVADKRSAGVLKGILEHTNRIFTLVVEGNADALKAEYGQHNFINTGDLAEVPEPEIISQPEDVAYLLFTSGTTGTPKGVPVSNKNVLSYLDHVLAAWEFFPSDRFSHTFDLTFDLSVHDMMVCWLSGACLCIPSEDAPLKMARYISEQKISVWFSVPSVAILMNRMRLLKENVLKNIRLSFFCGEPLPEVIAGMWKRASGGSEVVNLYGPTEATIAISAYTWDERNNKSKNGIVSIGRLFAGQDHAILDPGSLQFVKNKGELCLAGSQLIKAYLNDQEANRINFIDDKDFTPKRWYRTGDIVEEDAGGDLFFLGRHDAEVKISGFRVNLFEVDAIIRKLAGHDMVASILDSKTSPRIVTFVGHGAIADEKEIIQACRKYLPWYMIPEVIIFVEEMPLNANGKIDRNILKQRLNG